jgi:hypothetical protein
MTAVETAAASMAPVEAVAAEQQDQQSDAVDDAK